MKKLCVVLVLTAVPLAAFAQLAVPNSFTTGEIISAAAMNDNFSAITDSVNISGSAGNGGTLLPIAMATINTNAVVINGTPNIGATSHPANGDYRIEIVGETVDLTTHIALVTVHVAPAGSAVSAYVELGGGEVRVQLEDPNGVGVDGRFHLVVWRP